MSLWPVAKDFSIPPSGNPPSIRPSKLQPTTNSATSSPSSSPSAVSSMHPYFRPSVILHPEFSTLLSTSFHVGSSLQSHHHNHCPFSLKITLPNIYVIKSDSKLLQMIIHPKSWFPWSRCPTPSWELWRTLSSIDTNTERMVLFESGVWNPTARSNTMNACRLRSIQLQFWAMEIVIAAVDITS